MKSVSGISTNRKTQKTPAKRILSITIRRMIDESPDTSFLGEYSNSAKSEFSVDRKHSLECASVVPVNKESQRILTTARGTVAELQSSEPNSDTEEWQALEDAYNLLDGLVDELESPECDCGECGDMERGQYRYFNPSRNYKGETAENIHKYTLRDYERMESLNRGSWCFVGIRAEAEIGLPQLTSNPVIGQTYLLENLTSGGLFGVESDSEKSYLESVEREELSQLRDVLSQFGFSNRAIASAFSNIEHKNE